ncbi:MAG: ADP-glyceromanno-heptose 6-epimerase [Alphaproteobacteria bacterium]
MIVVTGGTGFIGSNIVAALGRSGRRELVVCDWFGTTDKWRNIAQHEIYEIIRPEDLFSFLNQNKLRIEAIIHMGAISNTTERDVDKIIAVNFRLSCDLWDWCSKSGTPFIYASSAATYGDGSAGFGDDWTPEALEKLRPLNAYGWSKHAFDRRVARLAASGRPSPLVWAGLKFFNVYGPNEYHKAEMRSVICQIVDTVQRGATVKLFKSHHPDYPDGGQLRDFVYVRDCADVVLWLLAQGKYKGIYNIGTGKARSFADLAHAVFRAMNLPPRIEYVDTPPEIRSNYQYFTQAEMGNLRALGYNHPFTELEDGVTDYVQNYLLASTPYI